MLNVYGLFIILIPLLASIIIISVLFKPFSPSNKFKAFIFTFIISYISITFIQLYFYIHIDWVTEVTLQQKIIHYTLTIFDLDFTIYTAIISLIYSLIVTSIYIYISKYLGVKRYCEDS